MINSIGERVKALRIKRGMNQTELGNLLGVKQVTVSMIEKNTNKPTIAQLEVLSDYFGVSIDWIVKGVEYGFSQPERELLNVVKEDNALYQSLTMMLNAKKNVMNRLSA